jgi:FKBP-type peptidyl-prolyl cis-trans isomerase (trigger factor)
MKTEVKKVDSTKREINIEVSGDIVKNKFEEAFQKINQEAKVSGFRPGHVPRDILEKNFSSAANEFVLKELIPEVYSKAVEKESLDVIDMPDIADVKLDRNMLSFKASVEVSPEINIKNYKGIKIGYKKIEVTLDDIKRFVDSLKESRKVDTVDDGFARSLGYPSLPALEKYVETQVYIQKQNQEHKRIENEIVDNLTKELDFKIPQSMVNRQLQEMLRQSKLDMALKGMPREQIDEREKAITEELAPEAKKQVKIYLVLSEIARKENISLDEHMPQRVLEFLLREADWKENL